MYEHRKPNFQKLHAGNIWLILVCILQLRNGKISYLWKVTIFQVDNFSIIILGSTTVHFQNDQTCQNCISLQSEKVSKTMIS